MKPILILIALILLFPAQIHAQRFFERFKHERPITPPCAPKIIGCIAIPVGCVAFTIGGFAYMVSAPMKRGQTRSQQDPFLAITIGGGVLIAGGIVLLIADAAHHRNNRLSLIIPKNNEVGLAYNF